MVMVSNRRASEEAWERQSFRKACFGIYIERGSERADAWMRFEGSWGEGRRRKDKND